MKRRAEAELLRLEDENRRLESIDRIDATRSEPTAAPTASTAST